MYLVGFCDTEGVPHRKNSKSSLWDMSIVFKYVVSEEFKLKKQIFHLLQFSHTQHAPKTSVKKPLGNFIQATGYLLQHYSCQHLCLCFWNTPHDKAVLRYYNWELSHTVDVMKLLKEKVPKGTCLKLDKQEVSVDIPAHSALGDALRISAIVDKYWEGPDDFLKSAFGVEEDLVEELANLKI